MAKTHQPIILHLIWVAWLIPYFGKRWAPDYFGNAPVQWGGAILVAVLVPIAVLRWWIPASPGGSRRTSWIFLFKAMAPLLIVLVVQGILVAPLTRTVSNWAGNAERDAALVTKTRDLARNGDDPKKREKAAAAAYLFFGTRIDWRDSTGTLQAFVPSKEDIGKRQHHHEANEHTQSVQRTVVRLLTETKWLLSLSTVSLAATLGAMLWRRKLSRTQRQLLDSKT